LDISYIVEITNKKIELLNQYKDLLYKLKSLDSESNNFTDIVESIIKKQSFIFDEFKEYDRVFLSLTKNNTELLNEIKYFIEEENRIKNELDKLISHIIEKFSKEKYQIKKIIDNIKIQNNNSISENNARFFEKKV
jgi:regulator of replication initiation timing